MYISSSNSETYLQTGSPLLQDRADRQLLLNSHKMALYGVYSHEECIVMEVEGSVTGEVSHRHFETNAKGRCTT